MLWDVFPTTSFLPYWEIPLVPSRKTFTSLLVHTIIISLFALFQTNIEQKLKMSILQIGLFNSSSFSNQRVDRMKTSINAKSITLGKKNVVSCFLNHSSTYFPKKVWLWGLWYDLHFDFILCQIRSFIHLVCQLPLPEKVLLIVAAWVIAFN